MIDNINIKGKYSELIVISELLKRGYSVFDSVCDCDGIDIIILKNNKCITIQIKSAHSFRKHLDGEVCTFRFGNTETKADYTILHIKDDFYIIPKSIISSINGITIYLRENRVNLSKYAPFINKWDI